MADLLSQTKLEKAGEVKIEQVGLVSAKGVFFDVTPQVVGIEIYEDIFAPFITGAVYIRDSQELSNLLPLIGEESIQFRISTPGLPEETAYEGRYIIYKMSDKQKIQEREQAYVIHFMSQEALFDLNKKVSRAYKGKVSDIIEEIIKGKDGLEAEDTKKKYNIEPSKNDTMFISNWWSPVKSIQFASDNAYNDNESPTYVFFENKYGMNWVTLDSLYDAQSLYTFKYDNYNAEVGSEGGSQRSIEEDYKRVLEFQTPTIFNYIDRLKSGMYGSEIIYWDILTQQYVHTGYNPNWEGTKHLNKNPTWTSDVAARTKAVLMYGKQYNNNFDGFDESTANTKVIQKRRALLAQAEAYKVTITVFGRTDYSAGQKVYLEVPKNKQIAKDDQEWLDEIQSGYYLIGAINHNITRESHECTMELIKDSYIIDVNAK